jgi:membrane associated rhomboid family serine protease
MIPLRDVIPSRTVPRVTLALLVVHAVVFVVAAIVAGERASEILRQNGDRVDGRWDIAAAASLVLAPTAGSWILTLGALWLFGENVEDRLGHVRFLASYVAIGLLAAATASLWGGDDPRASAGGVAGIIGTYLRLFPRSRVLVAVPTGLPGLAELPAAACAGAWFLLQFAAGVPALTLLTGCAAGLLAARLLSLRERLRVEWWGN